MSETFSNHTQNSSKNDDKKGYYNNSEIVNDLRENSNIDLMREISLNELDRAINKGKDRKSMGFDELPHEFLKNCSLKSKEIFRQFFNLILMNIEIPTQWKEDKVVLIYKGKGDKLKLDNFRTISIGSIIGKCFLRIIQNRLDRYVEQMNTLGEIQNAFRKGRRGTDSLFILTQLMEIAKLEKKEFFITFVDLRKAFDKVCRSKLWDRLQEINIEPKFIRLLRELYNKMKKKARVNEVETNWIDSDVGVRQGCVLSPTLFTVLLSEFGNRLLNSGIGMKLKKISIPGLFFADDMVLFARNEVEMKKSLCMLSEFCRDYQLEVNCSKTKIMQINSKENYSWEINTMKGVENIENVDEYKYLGVEINAKGNMFKSFENRILRSLKNKASAIKMKTTEGYDRKEIGDALWNYVGLGGSLFSCEVACFTKEGIKKIENIHNEMGRWLIHANRGIPNVAIRGELGWTNIYTKIAMRKLDYAKRILQLNENNWMRLIFEYIIQQDICTKWRKEILNLRINMEINNNESIRSQILGWHEKEWIKEVEEKSTLKYYNKK